MIWKIILYSNILMNNKSSLKTKVFIKPLSLACACECKRSEYNRNKEYFVNYYQQNQQRILTRVKNNYYLKVGRLKKPDRIIIKNEILENNIVISLMD